jgi:hypothetical protein
VLNSISNTQLTESVQKKTAWPIAYRCRGSTKTHQTSKATTTLSRGVLLFPVWLLKLVDFDNRILLNAIFYISFFLIP